MGLHIMQRDASGKTSDYEQNALTFVVSFLTDLLCFGVIYFTSLFFSVPTYKIEDNTIVVHKTLGKFLGKISTDLS